MPVVELRGNTELRMALQRFAPDLEKNLQLELRNGLKPIVKAAQSFVPSESPMSHWNGGKGFKLNPKTSMFRKGMFPLYNPSIIKRGIIYSTSVGKHSKKGFTSMARIMNSTAVGAIYETAGRKNPEGQIWVGFRNGDSKRVSRSANPTAGATFISKLPPLVSSKQGEGRLIYRAWNEDKGRTFGIVSRAIDKTRTEFYSRAKTTSFSKAA